MSIPQAVVGQSLRISATLLLDISTASAKVIKYKSPSGVTGSIPAVVDNAASGAIHADIPAATLSAPGTWLFLAECTFPTGEIAKTFGSPVEILSEFQPKT